MSQSIKKLYFPVPTTVLICFDMVEIHLDFFFFATYTYTYTTYTVAQCSTVI